MQTDCTPSRLKFHPHNRREVHAQFDGGAITSDGGSLLLREAERRSRIVQRLAECFEDHRDPNLIEHQVVELVGQRVVGLALGYEDLNDHDQLRLDPVLALVVGKKDIQGGDRKREQDRGKALAGKSTLNRLERTEETVTEQERYKKISYDGSKMDRLLVDVYMESQEKEPEEIILDLDATDDPLHGEQEGRFFHGYYGHYCYLPLYIFAGRDLLCARLRESNIDASAGALEEVERIVGQLRQRWPEVKVTLRGDSGFCRDEIMRWCEAHQVHYVLGLAKNERLKQAIARAMQEAQEEYGQTQQPSRVFEEFAYQTRDSWSRERRVVGKAEYLAKGENPRFVVTSFSAEEWGRQALYEQLYCARGEMENRIKEQQLELFADRTSTATKRGNQLRLYFSSFAYVLMEALRRIALKGTELARAQCGTIRLKLLKIGALIGVSVRRIVISLSSSCPYAGLFQLAYQKLTT